MRRPTVGLAALVSVCVCLGAAQPVMAAITKIDLELEDFADDDPNDNVLGLVLSLLLDSNAPLIGQSPTKVLGRVTWEVKAEEVFSTVAPADTATFGLVVGLEDFLFGVNLPDTMIKFYDDTVGTMSFRTPQPGGLQSSAPLPQDAEYWYAVTPPPGEKLVFTNPAGLDFEFKVSVNPTTTITGKIASLTSSSSTVIPEPSTLTIWSLLGALGLTVGWWRT